jgi:hypothetical protein
MWPKKTKENALWFGFGVVENVVEWIGQGARLRIKMNTNKLNEETRFRLATFAFLIIFWTRRWRTERGGGGGGGE